MEFELSSLNVVDVADRSVIVGRVIGGKGFVARCLSGEVNSVRDFIVLFIISTSRKFCCPVWDEGGTKL